MIKSYVKIPLAVCLLTLVLLFSGSASAQLVGGATFDFSGDAKSTMQTVEAKLSAIQEEVVAKVKENVTKVKAAIEKYAGKINKVLDKIPGTKDFDEGSSVDIYDTEAVKTAFTELFLQYPTEDERLNKIYELKSEQFYYDTLVEMKTAVIELESQLATLREEVEQFGEKAVSESSGSGETGGSEDESGVDYNAYMAARKFNDILKITEQLVAMQNQYYAARLIRQPRIVQPAPYQKEEEEKTGDVKKTSFIYGHSQMAFAQMLQKQQSVSARVSVVQPSVKAVSAAPSGAVLSAPKTTLSGSVLTAEKAVAPSTAVSKAAVSGTVEDKPVKKTIKSLNDFVTPSAPETSAFLQGNETELEALGKIAEAQKVVNQAAEVHNLLQRMPEYRDLYKQYSLFKRLHAKAVEAVKNADQCVVRYVGRRYSEPNKVWFGQKDEPEDTCDYDSRKGLSGWAITTFQVANASVGNDIDVDAFAEVDIDTSNDSAALAEVDTDKLEKQSGEQVDDDMFASPSKAQEFSDSVREVELLNWQIGRKAAQYLVDDQNSEKPVYGKATNPYPLWNDQKNYYNQYLNGKYENMKSYISLLNLNKVALQIAEILNNGESESDEKAANARGLNAIESALGSGGSSDGGATGILASKARALATVRANQADALAPFEKKLAELDEKIDGWSSLIDSKKSEINKIDEESKLNEGRAENAQKEIELMDERGTSSYSSTYTMAKQTLKEAGEAQAESITRLGELRSSTAKYENARKDARAEKTKLEEKVKILKQQYQEDIVAVENEYDARIAALGTEGNAVSKLTSVYSALKLNNSSLRSILGKADDLVDKARSCAQELIQKHQDELQAMAANDVLYMPENNTKVVSGHEKLIKQLENLPKVCFDRKTQNLIGLGNVNPDSIVSLLTGIFKSELTKSVCSNYSCDAPDTQYFVGLPAKARDFTAPRAPLTTRYPTVRDMVHLDTTDYKKIDMGTDGKLSRNAFLNYGLTQPYVWQLMLSDKAYVERGMDLSAALDMGGEGKAFMRGNILPCRAGNYIIDMSNSGKYAITDTKKYNNPENIKKLGALSECRDLNIAGVIPGIANVLDTYVIYDKDVDSTVVGNASGGVSDPKSSELGMFLRYKKGSLSMNERPYDGYTRLIEKEKRAEKSGKYELNADDNAYQRAMFTKNQIGDFLHFVDKESRIKKNLDEIEAGMEEIKATLKEVFTQIGFEFKDSLDLADSGDYDYVVKKLNERKVTLMSEAGAELDTVNHSNAVVKERFDKVNNTYSALVQDSHALVSISARTEAGSPLSETMATETANQKVIEKARNEGYAAIEKEINNYEQPVCIPY